MWLCVVVHVLTVELQASLRPSLSNHFPIGALSHSSLSNPCPSPLSLPYSLATHATCPFATPISHSPFQLIGMRSERLTLFRKYLQTS